MIERSIYTPPGGPPQGPGPNPEIYRIMGEANIFRMMLDFYKELEKSEMFFVTLLGGPPLYLQKYGSPRLRARHLPFEIDEPARQVWLRCFDNVLEGSETKYNFPGQHLEGFKDFLKSFSAWMVNKA